VGGLIRILGFVMLAYVVLTIIRAVIEAFWPGKIRGRRRK